MTDTVSTTATTESVEEFALRARTWLAENMPPIDPENPPFSVRAETESWERAKELQKRLLRRVDSRASASRASTAVSAWTMRIQKAFNDECLNYEMPLILNTPSFTICGATILDMGSEDQKRRAHFGSHPRRRGALPAALRAQRQVRIWPASSPAPNSRATRGSSTVPRRGAPARSPPTTG